MMNAPLDMTTAINNQKWTQLANEHSWYTNQQQYIFVNNQTEQIVSFQYNWSTENLLT